MQRALTVFVCLLSILTAGCATHLAPRTEKRADENAARSVALRWLQLLDQGDYEEDFEWEAQDFRIYRTQRQFVCYMQARRAPFGRTLSRTCIGRGSSGEIRRRAGRQLREYDFQNRVRAQVPNGRARHPAKTANRLARD